MTTPRTLTCDEVRELAPLFVTGALEPDEEAAIRDHLAGCDDMHDELAELGGVATALLETTEPAEPSPMLKQRLMAAASADLLEGRHPSSVAAPATAPAPVTDLGVARDRRRARIAWLVATAAIIAVLVIGGVAVSLRRDLDAAEAYQDGVNQALDLAAQPGSVTALLTGDAGKVSGFAVVGADGTVRMTVQGLDATTGSEVYTSWVIVGDAAPVAIGEFTVGADGVATASAVAPAAVPGAVLALTLEPAPGATTPTLPIIASGSTRVPAG